MNVLTYIYSTPYENKPSVFISNTVSMSQHDLEKWVRHTVSSLASDMNFTVSRIETILDHVGMCVFMRFTLAIVLYHLK